MEKVRIHVSKTVFLPKSEPDMGKIQEITVTPHLEKCDEESKICKGTIDLKINYTLPECMCEEVASTWQANLKLDWQDEIAYPCAIEGTPDISLEDLNWQQLEERALELDLTMILAIAEQEKEQLVVIDAAEDTSVPQIKIESKEEEKEKVIPAPKTEQKAVEGKAQVTYRKDSLDLDALASSVATYRLCFYRVQNGEDLDAVAEKHALSRESIIAANRVGEEDIKTGMLLTIPTR